MTMTLRNSNGQSSNTAVCEPQLEQSAYTAVGVESRAIARMKSLYQADQQAKFLNLHAETESLLQQLQTLKQQRQSVN